MISATILTKNSARTLEKTLHSLRAFPEVVLLDTGSTDDTLAISAGFPNVSIHTSPFIGFGPLHNLAATLAKHPWILSIDSDEALSPFLAEEILSLSLNPNCIYGMRRHNFFEGKRIKYCSRWGTDTVFRLYHKETTCFTNDLVHERIKAEKGNTQILTAHLEHRPYLVISDFLKKMELYTNLSAEQYKGRAPSSLSPFFHGTAAFLKSYFVKGGLFAGKQGLVLSLYQSHTAFYKYLKILERTGQKRR